MTENGFVETHEISAEASYGVELYLIRFTTTALDGGSATVAAHLAVPRLDDPMEVPVYVFGPGTTGLTDQCAPSAEHVRGADWGNYLEHTVAHAGHGVIGMMPDYMGFGDTEMLQPYLVAEAEARVMLDAIRAVERFFEDGAQGAHPGGAFVAGYSQGGHAAFAAADLQASYAPDTELLGVIGYGPTTDVVAVLREFTVVAPLLVYAYAQVYGTERIDPTEILAGEWLANLEDDVTSMCIDAIQQYYPLTPEPLFTAAFTEALLSDRLADTYPEAYELFSKNSVGLAGHGIPALILQGTDDPVVRVETQNTFVELLCEAGSSVSYRRFEGVRHNTRNVGFAEAQAWMSSLAAGEPRPDDCEAMRGASE